MELVKFSAPIKQMCFLSDIGTMISHVFSLPLPDAAIIESIQLSQDDSDLEISCRLPAAEDTPLTQGGRRILLCRQRKHDDLTAFTELKASDRFICLLPEIPHPGWTGAPYGVYEVTQEGALIQD